MTDVTGFDMIGHLREVAKGSGVSMRLFPSKVPPREAALECMRRGDVPGG
jgi:selenide,water dikinase